MAYTKEYTRINWENEPSINTPLNETNLNKIDYTVKKHDDTFGTWDETKANVTDLQKTVGLFGHEDDPNYATMKPIEFDSSTGTFTIYRSNGTSYTLDTDIEKIAINFDYDDNPTSAHYQNLVIELDDGTYKYIDMSALITQYEFTDTSTIHFAVAASGAISASVINGSITEDKLQPNFLADCRNAKTEAQTAATNASNSADDANDSAEDAEAWAVGQRNGIDVPSTDPAYHNNAKYWSEQSAGQTFAGLADVDINDSTLANGQVPVYNATTQKWKNGNIDVSGKADKVSSATNGNFAGLDSNGNLTDSGSKASDFATASSVSAKLTGKIFGTTTTLDGTTVSFSNIDNTKTYQLEAEYSSGYDGALVGISNVQISGTTITYTVTNATTGQSFKLVEIG